MLVAYNVWLADGVGVDEARRVAAAVRRPGVVRALGLDVGGRAQVSMNLVDPLVMGPAEAFDAVQALVAVDGAELVGLVPAAVLDAVPRGRWAELDLGPSRTIEARLAGPPGEASRTLATPDAVVGASDATRNRDQAEAAASRLAMVRSRRMRRRSRSLSPPQMPNFSPLTRAYSRHSVRTTQPRHTALASLVDAPRSGKNRSGSTPRQFACHCQVRSPKSNLCPRRCSTGPSPHVLVERRRLTCL